jgi:ATP-dependent DNA helicase RecG
VASATGREAEYVEVTGLDNQHFRALVLKLLALGPQPRAKINRLLLDKLPASIAGDQKRRDFIKALLQEMVRQGEIENIGGATRAARWALTAR